MSKFYADENIRIQMVQEMRAKGLDVQTSPEANNDGITDPEQLDYATSQNRIILTDNRRDFIKLHNDGQEHAGIFSYKPHSLSVEQATARTHYVSEQVSDMQNTHVRINEGDWMIERHGVGREEHKYSAEFRKQEYLDTIDLEQEIDMPHKDIERC